MNMKSQLDKVLNPLSSVSLFFPYLAQLLMFRQGSFGCRDWTTFPNVVVTNP